jgi:hypothetical protein
VQDPTHTSICPQHGTAQKFPPRTAFADGLEVKGQGRLRQGQMPERRSTRGGFCFQINASPSLS